MHAEYINIFIPLQKPPKKTKKGEKKTNNLRPVILLTTVRKIFVIERTWGKLKDRIPKGQAAYQKGRNTTEQIMCMKLNYQEKEKAIISENYKLL